MKAAKISMQNSIILTKINALLEYFQSKLSFLKGKSLFFKNFDNFIFLSILLTIFAGLFCSTNIIGYCIFLTLFLSVINLFIDKRQFFEPKAFDAALFIFLIISMISMFNSTLPMASLKGFMKTLTYIGFYFSAIQFFSNNKSKIKHTVIFAAGCVLFESIIAIIQNYTDVLPLASWQDLSHINPEDVLSRAFGTLKPYNPNLLAAYLVVGFPMLLCTAFSSFIENNKKFAFFSCFASIISALAIIFTGSRGAYLALGAMIFALGFISYQIIFKDFDNNKFKKYWKIIVFGFSGIFILFVLSSPAILKRILSIFVMRGDSSTSFRMNVYKASFEMFKDNPLLGIGLGNTTFREIYGYYMLSGFDALSAYSIYLETAVETGILGLCAFLSFLFLLLKPSIKFIMTKNEIGQKIFVSCCVLSLVGAMVHGFFDTVFFRPQVQTLFWLVVAILNTNLNTKEV